MEPTRVTLHALPGGKFMVTLADRVLLEGCRDPVFEVCRVLQAEGLAGPLVTRWHGAKHDAMRVSSIARGATRTTREEPHLRTRMWTPHPEALKRTLAGAGAPQEARLAPAR